MWRAPNPACAERLVAIRRIRCLDPPPSTAVSIDDPPASSAAARRVGPEAERQAGGIGGAERGGLGNDRLADVDAQDVGLQLHAQRVRGDSAVNFQHRQVDLRVLFHGVNDVAGLVADRLQRGPREVCSGVVAR